MPTVSRDHSENQQTVNRRDSYHGRMKDRAGLLGFAMLVPGSLDISNQTLTQPISLWPYD